MMVRAPGGIRTPNLLIRRDENGVLAGFGPDCWVAICAGQRPSRGCSRPWESSGCHNLCDQSVTNIKIILSSSPESTVHGEVERLVRTGVLTSRRLGRARLIEPNTDNPATRPLRDLVLIAYGPQYVMGEQLAGVGGISEAFLHGSWAARFHG